MTQLMSAAVIHQFGTLPVVEDVPVPTPAPHQILVKVIASGVCHTDLHAADGDWPVKPKLPFIPGHEAVGYVAATGHEVTTVKEGDRVGIPWLHTACGYCEHCINGWETLCAAQQNTGYSVDGGYAEYALADPRFVGRIPANTSFVEIAPILCAGVTTYKGLKETDTRAGQWVAISGIGGLGHVAVQYAKAMGLHVVAIDVGEEKLTLARKLGADVTLNAAETDPCKEVQKQLGGVHGVLVTAASAAAFRQAMGLVRPGGTCVFNGLPAAEFTAPIFDLVLNRITIRGSIVGTRTDLQEALAFAGEGKVRCQIETHALGSIGDIFTRLKQGHVTGRVVLKLAEEG